MNAMANLLLVNDEPRKLDPPGVQLSGVDGQQTMRENRKNPQFCSLPNLALASKGMNGNREKCLAAGMYDNIAKPVNLDQLLLLLRVRLDR